MKKFLITFVILTLTMAVLALALNVPRQQLLFFNIGKSLENATNVSTEVANILNVSVLNDLDPETNVPDISTRFNYNFYPDSPIYAVELSVIASKYLGIEKSVLKAYPLEAPTFTDIESVLTQKYQNKNYDFSRDFGYFEYVNDYMKRVIDYPLFDKNVGPLTLLTKAEVIKALVRLFAAKTQDVSMVKLAETLSKRFSSNPKSGIVNPKDVGYISVFEMYFFSNEKGKLVPLIDLPIFTQDNKLNPNSLASRWWTIALSTMICFEKKVNVSSNPKLLVPVRTFNNFMTYVSYKNLGYNIFVLSLPQMKKGIVKSIKASLADPAVFAVNMKDGKDVVGLDNTQVTVNSTIIEPNGNPITTSKTYIGRDFVGYFNSLPDFPKVLKIVNKVETGKLMSSGKNYYLEINGKKVSLPEDSTVEVIELKVGKSNELIKLYKTSDFSELINTSSDITIQKRESFRISEIGQQLKGIRVRVPVEIKEYSNKNESKMDFENAGIMYYPVVDRLNLERKMATLGSIEKFNVLYKDGAYDVNSLDKVNFVKYWRDVARELENLNLPSTAVISGKIRFDIHKKIKSGSNFEYKTAHATIWEIYVGKLVSFEPASYQMFTQAYVKALPYSKNAQAYITFKNGKSKYYSNFQDAVNDLYTTQNGAQVLRNIALWLQFTVVKNKEGGTSYKVDYIIGKEL